MFRSSLLGYAILAATASGNLRFFHSLPLLGALPTQGSLAAGCSRNRVHAKLEGYGTASEIDLIAGHLWESGVPGHQFGGLISSPMISKLADSRKSSQASSRLAAGSFEKLFRFEILDRFSRVISESSVSRSRTYESMASRRWSRFL